MRFSLGLGQMFENRTIALGTRLLELNEKRADSRSNSTGRSTVGMPTIN